MKLEDTLINKKLVLLAVKYVPAIMALTCCCKMLIFECIEARPNIINWINVLLNMFIVCVFYIEGIVFQFCSKHRNLCKIALLGYVFYILFMIFNPSPWITVPLCLVYIKFVIIMLIMYEGI